MGVLTEGPLTGLDGIRLRCAGTTHTGQVRERNEDAFGVFLSSEGLPLPVDAALLVSDGVGGHVGGQEASRFVVDAVRDTLASVDAPIEKPAELLDALLHGVHRELLRQAGERGFQGGMGATATLAILQGETLHLAQVGDSRGYRLRDGELLQLTRDDSWVAEQERVAPGSAGNGGPGFGRNVLTQCLGIGASLKVQVVPETAREGDRYLLCSDGLHGPVSDGELLRVLSTVADPSAAVERLVAMANEAGGPDNISAVVFDIGAVPVAAVAPPPVPASGRTLSDVEIPAAFTGKGTGRATGTLLTALGAGLLVVGSAAGYWVSRPDEATVPASDPAASPPPTAAPAPESSNTTPIPALDPPPSVPDNEVRLTEFPPEAPEEEEEEAPLTVEPAPRDVPADTTLTRPDSVPDGPDSVTTPREPGPPPQE